MSWCECSHTPATPESKGLLDAKDGNFGPDLCSDEILYELKTATRCSVVAV